MSVKIIYIMGVSGSGKTTVGKLVSDRTDMPFYDGDDFHPPENISKMESGSPLNDADRKNWLIELNRVAKNQIQKHESALIVSSALKEKYRNILAQDIESHVCWVYLKGNFETISSRLKNRDEHFMPPSLLRSQFDTLEEPKNGLHIPITQKPTKIANEIMKRLEL